MKKINYGIDAPQVIRNLSVIGVLLLFCAVFLPDDLFPPVSNILKNSSLIPAICLLGTAFFMVLYAKFGKFRHRDRMLDLHNWQGDERVLDVGTGAGLLMIGAAKRLTGGKSTGIDIFNQYDLSGNSLEQTRTNVELEGVAAKVEILSANILRTNFADDDFDVIVSNLCLHNLYQTEGREQACAEIFRILKPGGTAIISDYKNTAQYKTAFERLGMKVERVGTYFLDAFPPLTIITATKK